MSRASNTLTQAARTEELATWLLRHAEDDDNAALQQALAVLAPPDRADEAIVVYEQAAQARDAAALERAAERLADTGRPTVGPARTGRGSRPRGTTGRPGAAGRS